MHQIQFPPNSCWRRPRVQADNITSNDVQRRNRIAKLLSDWGLIEIGSEVEDLAPLNQIKVLSFKDKGEWTLESKYNIGKKKTPQEVS